MKVVSRPNAWCQETCSAAHSQWPWHQLPSMKTAISLPETLGYAAIFSEEAFSSTGTKCFLSRRRWGANSIMQYISLLHSSELTFKGLWSYYCPNRHTHTDLHVPNPSPTPLSPPSQTFHSPLELLHESANSPRIITSFWKTFLHLFAVIETCQSWGYFFLYCPKDFCFVLLSLRTFKASRQSRYSWPCYVQTINSPFLQKQKPLFLWDPSHPTAPSSPSPFLFLLPTSLWSSCSHTKAWVLGQSFPPPIPVIILKEQSVQYPRLSIPRPRHTQSLFIHSSNHWLRWVHWRFITTPISQVRTPTHWIHFKIFK